MPVPTRSTSGTPFPLTGKVALVTGGSRGIGAAIVRALAQAGADVALTYLRAEAAAHAVVTQIEDVGRSGLALRADSADPESVVGAVDAAAQTFGRLDVLVNNAGVFPFGSLSALSVEDIDHTLAVHVRAPLVAAQAAARHMGPGGRIITIGSSLAERVPYEGVTLYAASKAATVGMTKGLARDLGGQGITAVVVHPGSTDTDMNPANGPGADAERAWTALGRYARPEDVAAAVVYLAGDGGRAVTGTAIYVDGGMTA